MIYAIEGNDIDQRRTILHLEKLEQAGYRFVISDLTRTECLVPILGVQGGLRLAEYYRFFHNPGLRTITPTAAAFARASAIRGGHVYPAVALNQPKRYGLADAIHLAVAIESGCEMFLTNDRQLANFADIQVESLP